jgi:hypothetical protein
MDPELCIAVWRDNSYRDGWHGNDQLGGAAVECTTVGWCVHEDDEGTSLAQSRTDSGQWGNVQHILASCLVSIVRIDFVEADVRPMRRKR